MTCGAAWIDYNNDGLLDVYLTDRDTCDRIFRNMGGNNFIDVSEELLLGISVRDGSGVSVADYDNDG